MADERIEHGFAFHFDRFAGGAQFGVAFAAAERLAQPFVGHAVSLAAIGAGQHQATVVEFNIGIHGDSEFKRIDVD